MESEGFLSPLQKAFCTLSVFLKGQLYTGVRSHILKFFSAEESLELSLAMIYCSFASDD